MKWPHRHFHLFDDNSDKREDCVDVGGRQHEATAFLQKRFFGSIQTMMKFAPDENKLPAQVRQDNIRTINKSKKKKNESALHPPQIVHVTPAELLGEEHLAEG